MQGASIIIGTRGSELALRQTHLVSEWLGARFPGLEIAVRTIRTEADRLSEKPVAALGDKGVFVRAIEQELLDGTIDLAVHSLKDVPADVETPGLVLAAFSPRADPRDAFISREGRCLADMPPGSRIGTSSPRRRVQLRQLQSDLVFVDIRGNVDTRLRKLEDGQYDGIVLAVAGLQRLGLVGRATEYFDVDRCVPDAGQGIIALQTRDVGEARRIAEGIDDARAHACGSAERAVVRALGANCHSPVGAYATIQGGRIRIRAAAARGMDSAVHRLEETGRASNAAGVGEALGTRLLAILERD